MIANASNSGGVGKITRTRYKQAVCHRDPDALVGFISIDEAGNWDPKKTGGNKEAQKIME